MKSQFCGALQHVGATDNRVVLITGDLGFNAFEKIMCSFGDRFVNAGVAEQNMVGIAAGMAHQGLRPWVYSIAPFLVLKTLEQVRNDVCYLRLPIKFIGNGGGYGYGIMGATHHILEDIAIYTTLPNMKLYIPAFIEDVEQIVFRMASEEDPAYLRLNYAFTHTLTLPPYSGTRHLICGSKVTVIVLGPLVHNVLNALQNLGESGAVDVWCISEFPLELPVDLIKSIIQTKKLLVVEEHIKDGGLGEKLFSTLTIINIGPLTSKHLFAKRYPSKLYGSQQFHWKESQLDAEGILENIKQLLYHE